MGNFRPETMLDKSLGNPAVLSAGSCRSSVVMACGAIMFLWGHVLISASGGPGRSSVVGLGMQHVDKHCIGIRHHHRAFWSISNLYYIGYQIYKVLTSTFEFVFPTDS